MYLCRAVIDVSHHLGVELKRICKTACLRPLKTSRPLLFPVEFRKQTSKLLFRALSPTFVWCRSIEPFNLVHYDWCKYFNSTEHLNKPGFAKPERLIPNERQYHLVELSKMYVILNVNAIQSETGRNNYDFPQQAIKFNIRVKNNWIIYYLVNLTPL